MKKSLLIALSSVFMAGFVACTDDETVAEQPDGPLTVTPISLEFTADGGSETLDVTGNNWDAVPNADWIEVEKGDDKITVTVEKNEMTELREGSISVRNEDDSKTISVKQAAAEEKRDPNPALDVEVAELFFWGDGETKTVTVTSEPEWEATSEADWIEIEKTDDGFTVTAEENGDEGREASITVTNGFNTKEISVTQDRFRHRFPYAWAPDLQTTLKDANIVCGMAFCDFPQADGINNGYAAVPYFVIPTTAVDITARYIDVPPGTYSVAEGTLNSGLFSYYENEIVTGMYMIMAATINVQGDSSDYTITMDMSLVDMMTMTPMAFYAYWEGSVEVDNPAVHSDFDEDIIIGAMNMTEGLQYFSFSQEQLPRDVYVAECYGEGIEILRTAEGNFITGTGWLFQIIQFHQDLGTGMPMPDGTYTIENSNDPGKVLAGYANIGGGSVGLWVSRMEDNLIVKRGPVVSGTVKSTRSGDNYTLVVNGMDDMGNVVTATVTGQPAPPAPAPLQAAANGGSSGAWRPYTMHRSSAL